MLKTLLMALLSCNLFFFSSVLLAEEPIQPIKAATPKNKGMVELGKMLFFDPRLSKSGFISCNSCHNLSMGGTDNIKTSIGHKWQHGPINAPTVLNSSMNLAQFLGRSRQRLKRNRQGGPIANPGEMAFTHKLAVDVLRSIPQYRGRFKQVFGADEISIDMVTDAIAAFEETLWLHPIRVLICGSKETKKPLARLNWKVINYLKKVGCASCHHGTAVGGTSFQKMGVLTPYKTASKVEGRKEVTGKDTDRFVFKVPTLRNVELTYPYFHDGAAASLEEAVNTMGRLQLGHNFSIEENAKIVAFLKTLNWETT